MGHCLRQQHIHQKDAGASEWTCLRRFSLRGEFNYDGKLRKREGLDPIRTKTEVTLLSGDSRTEVEKVKEASLVITDPPYAGNVNYSELADFFYVWLRLILKTKTNNSPEYCPKTPEIVENRSRGLSMGDFEAGLTAVLTKCAERLADGGLLVFTFHHAEGSSWESVLNSICSADLVLEAIYPVHAESEVSLHLMDKEAIAYDLIHVCRRRRPETRETNAVGPVCANWSGSAPRQKSHVSKAALRRTTTPTAGHSHGPHRKMP